MSFWLGLSFREKLMVSMAAVLAVVVVGQIFIVRPIMVEREALNIVLDRQNSIIKELAIIPRETLQASAQAASGNSNVDSVRQSLLASATNAGLAVNRIQANDTGVTLYFDRTFPELFFVWVRTVEAELGLKPEKFNIRRLGEAEIRASVEYVGG